MAHDDSLQEQAGPEAGAEGKTLTENERFLQAKEVFETRSFEG